MWTISSHTGEMRKCFLICLICNLCAKGVTRIKQEGESSMGSFLIEILKGFGALFVLAALILIWGLLLVVVFLLLGFIFA